MLGRLGTTLFRRLLAMNAKTLWMLAAALVALAIAGSALRSRVATSPTVLIGRVWIDHLPERDTEHFEIFIAIDEGSLGVFEKASAYQGSFEVFKYEPRGDGKLQLLFPQTKKKVDITYDAKACSEKGFDYCLTLGGAPRGAPKYFSKKGWELDVKDPAELQRVIEQWERTTLKTESD
jgi:hypothetical protein